MKEAVWHSLEPTAVLQQLETSREGLDADEVAARRSRFGANELPQHKGPSALRLLLTQLRSPLLYALVVSAAVAVALGEVEDGIIVATVVVINALIGFVQEFRAEQAIAALAELVAEPAKVRRDGVWRQAPAADLVPGDIVEVEAGELVVADVRLISAHRLRTQEASLTGESVPVRKRAEPAPSAAALADRHSLLFAGTLVAAGTGTGVVVATGTGTEVGRISGLLDEVDPLQTPLTRELDRVGRFIAAAIGVVAVLIVAVAIVRGFELGDAALAGISLAVAAVPEGLPAVVTIALAVGVRRMAARGAIIRRLPAVEILGSTTVVASDKTGTLTRNEMTVSEVWTAPSEDEAELLLAGVLCNDAVEASLGDPTETALIGAAAGAGLDVEAARAEHPRLDAMPFDADRKLMATAHRQQSGGTILYVKGAPEAVLPLCRDVDDDLIAGQVDDLAARGRRVLAFAVRRRPGPGPIEGNLSELRFLGLQAMIDPPREAAPAAVAACHQAGVRVVMITGDHPRTAGAIGAELGLAAASAMTGPELETAGEDELAGHIARTDVYARVAPEHKLRLVRALQAGGAVVAMTGDGVNDAPALRQADIGVAMGRGGTAAAKQAADMVLADDDFSTLSAAIREGRRVYDNLVKALSFVLPTSLGQALIIAVAVAAFPLYDGEPLLPVQPVQILWINLIVAVALALPLAFEAAEPDVMTRPPRDPQEPLLDLPLLVRSLLVGVTLTAVALVLFVLERDHQLEAGASEAVALSRAQTLAVTGAVLLQALYLLSCRSLTRSNREIGLWSNPLIYAGIGLVLALQALFVFAPFMHDVFGSTDLSVRALVWAAAGALALLPVTALEERWRVRRAAQRRA